MSLSNISETASQIRAAFIQFDVRQGAIEQNLAAVDQGLAAMATAGPGVIVLPELWATGFAYDRLAELADRTPELLQWLQERARHHDVLIAGSLPEKTTAGCYNTMYIIGPRGICGQYRKQQLFAPMGEERFFTAGDNPLPIDTPLGPIGALVCYDLRFADLAATQAARGARLLLVSAQWPAARLGHWRTLVRARAIENQMFCIACNRCGTTGDTPFAGHSMIVAPDGTVLAEAGDDPATTLRPLDMDRLEEIRGRFRTAGRTPYRFSDADKVTSVDRLQHLVAANRKLGRKTVFTNGCFDILHAGHVTYLEAARRLGDCLVVGLNSDASIRRIKGPARPINPEQDRARVLAALGCVDHVVLFDDDTPLRLITALLPDILVKGADWAAQDIVGGPEVMAAGGTVITIPLVADRSTTGIIEQIKTKRR